MDNLNITVDSDVLQEKAKEFAMKGALKAIEDFYTGYDSPYKKAIVENLSQNTVDSYNIKLPDILCLINDHLTAEVDKIANTAVAKSFIPLVSRVLTRQDKEAKFSDILKEFIGSSPNSDGDIDDFTVSVKKNATYHWLSIHISDRERSYDFTLHATYESQNTDKVKYKLISLPSTEKTETRKMKLQVEGGTLEMPFVKDILSDKFVSSLASYIISSTEITMDTTEFDDDMFPERCHCH